jgi:hypothetical protein
VPISSRGNIILLMMALFGQDASQALSYSVYLHMGIGLAALVYLRKYVGSILLRRDEQSRRLFNFLLIATLFTGLVGLPIFLFLEASFGYGEAILGLMGLALIATGLIQRASPRKEDKGIDLGLRDGIVFGSIQGLSVIPGLSRSGLTTSAFLFKRFGGGEGGRLQVIVPDEHPGLLCGIYRTITSKRSIRFRYVNPDRHIGCVRVRHDVDEHDAHGGEEDQPLEALRGPRLSGRSRIFSRCIVFILLGLKG